MGGPEVAFQTNSRGQRPIDHSRREVSQQYVETFSKAESDEIAKHFAPQPLCKETPSYLKAHSGRRKVGGDIASRNRDRTYPGEQPSTALDLMTLFGPANVVCRQVAPLASRLHISLMIVCYVSN